MKLKKLFIVLVCLSLLVTIAGPVFAARGDREQVNFGYVETSSVTTDGVAISRPCLVYAVQLYASSANATADIYDLVATPASATDPRIEIGEASQYDSVRWEFNPPLNMENGAWVEVNTGCTITLEFR